MSDSKVQVILTDSTAIRCLEESIKNSPKIGIVGCGEINFTDNNVLRKISADNNFCVLDLDVDDSFILKPIEVCEVFPIVAKKHFIPEPKYKHRKRYYGTCKNFKNKR